MSLVILGRRKYLHREFHHCQEYPRRQYRWQNRHWQEYHWRENVSFLDWYWSLRLGWLPSIVDKSVPSALYSSDGRAVITVVSDTKRDTSSTFGMSTSVATSTLLSHRIAKICSARASGRHRKGLFGQGLYGLCDSNLWDFRVTSEHVEECPARTKQFKPACFPRSECRENGMQHR